MGFVLPSLPCFPLKESGLVFCPQVSLGIFSFPDFLCFHFHGILASSSRECSRSGSTTSWAFMGSSGSVLAGSVVSSSSSSIVIYLPLHGSASALGFGEFHRGARTSCLRWAPAPSCHRCCRRRAVRSFRLVVGGDAVRCRRVGLLIGDKFAS